MVVRSAVAVALLALTVADVTCKGKSENTLSLIQREARLQVGANANARTVGVCENQNKTKLVEELREIFTNNDKYKKHVKRMFEDREKPTIMIAGYQPKKWTDGHWNLQNMLNNFLANADRAAVADSSTDDPVYFNVMKMNLNRASYNICTNASTFKNIHLDCIDLSEWLEEVGDPECDWPFEVVLWARSQLFWKASSKSRAGVLLLGMDVLLHRNLFDYIKQNRRWKSHIMSSTAWGKIGDCGWRCSLICGDVVFADESTADFMNAWAKQNIEWLDADFGDQDSLNDLMVNQGWRPRVDVIPPEVAGQCGEPGQYLTHYNCVPDKVEAMMSHSHWLV